MTRKSPYVLLPEKSRTCIVFSGGFNFMIEVDRNHIPVKKITEDKTRNRTIKELLPTANSFMVVLMEFQQFLGDFGLVLLVVVGWIAIQYMQIQLLWLFWGNGDDFGTGTKISRPANMCRRGALNDKGFFVFLPLFIIFSIQPQLYRPFFPRAERQKLVSDTQNSFLSITTHFPTHFLAFHSSATFSSRSQIFPTVRTEFKVFSLVSRNV